MKEAGEARKELAALADSVSDEVLLLLTLYLLDVLAKDDDALESKVSAMREKLRTRHTLTTFQKMIEKSGGNMQVVVLSRLLQDATTWLFAGSPAAVPSGAS